MSTPAIDNLDYELSLSLVLPVANMTNWELATRRRRPRVAIDSGQSVKAVH